MIDTLYEAALQNLSRETREGFYEPDSMTPELRKNVTCEISVARKNGVMSVSLVKGTCVIRRPGPQVTRFVPPGWRTLSVFDWMSGADALRRGFEALLVLNINQNRL
jgi:hypothetical protein